MAKDRRQDVLRAIVTDYVATGEPVGSKTLVDRYELGVSPATVRNDMSVLEEQGYLYQPHTSAGRIPTDKGYRAFVDQIASLQPLQPAQKRAVESFLLGAVDFDEVVERTVRVLAQMTRQLAVVQYPRIRAYGLRHLELVSVAEKSLLVIVITDSARVEQRTIPTTWPLAQAEVQALRTFLNSRLAGANQQQVAALSEQISQFSEQIFAPGDLEKPDNQVENSRIVELVQEILSEVSEVLTGEQSERIVMAGAGNLVRSGTEFRRSIGPILDALEEQVALLRLFAEIDQSGRSVAVSIGQETGEESLGETAIVAGTYGSADRSAHVGVVGPTRMDYPGTMSAVRAVSKYLSQAISENNRKNQV